MTDGSGNDVSGNAGHIANRNPLRYRGYYYDTDTGHNFLQSRYYDPEIGRFINADDPGLIASLSQSTVMGTNLFVYCDSNPVNDLDPSGHLSLKSALAKISQFLKKVVSKFTSYLKTLIKFNKKKRTLSINTTLIATAIDAAIAAVVNWLIYRTVKLGIKLLLQSKKIRSSFINGTFNFFLKNKVGKLVLRTIVYIGLIVAGKKGAAGKIADGLMKGFLSNIAFSKSRILQKASSLISAFSSVGGIVALFLDLMDKKWDDYFTVKV